MVGTPAILNAGRRNRMMGTYGVGCFCSTIQLIQRRTWFESGRLSFPGGWYFDQINIAPSDFRHISPDTRAMGRLVNVAYRNINYYKIIW